MSCKVEFKNSVYQDFLKKHGNVSIAMKKYLELETGTSLSAKEENKFTKVMKNKEKRLAKLQNRISNLKNTIKQQTGKDSIASRKELANLEKRKEELLIDIEHIEQQAIVEGLRPVFEEDRKYIESIIDSEDPDDYESIRDIMDMYEQMADFSDLNSASHPIYSQSELQDIDLDNPSVKLLQEWSAAMQTFKAKLSLQSKKRVLNYINNSNRLKEKLTLKDLDKAIKDLNIFDSQITSLGNGGLFGGASEVAKTMMDYIVKTKAEAALEIGKKTKKHRSLLEKAQAKLQELGYEGKNMFDLFKQMNKGNFTGRLVSKFSQSYFDSRSNAYNEMNRKIKNAKTNEEMHEAYQAKEKWKLENELTFDIRKLDDIDTPSKFKINDNGEHKRKLIELLGKEGYEREIELQNNSIRLYRDNKAYVLETLLEEYNIKDLSESSEAYDKFEIWKRVNSPFWGAAYLFSTDRSNLTYKGQFLNKFDYEEGTANFRGYYQLRSVPRKNKAKATWKDNKFEVTETNEKLDYYDEKFALIEQHKEVLDYYNFISSTLADIQEHLPHEIQKKFSSYYDLPLYKKDFIETLMENGGFKLLTLGKAGIDHFHDSLVDGISDNETSTLENANGVSYNFIGDRASKVRALIDLKVAQNEELTRVTRENLPYEKYQEFRAEAEHEITNDYSFDLGKIMEIYIYQATQAKFKELNLPALQLMQEVAKTLPKAKTTNFNKLLYTEEGTVAKDDLPRKNEIGLIEHSMKLFKGQATNKVSAPTEKKVYTRQEVQKKKELERLLDSEISQSEKDNIQEQLSKLGKNVTGSGIGRTILSYLRILGLGWNVNAMLPNAAAGYFANFIEASDGRIFNLKAMKKAYKLASHSTLKLASLGKVQTDIAKKINNFVVKSDILQDSTNEFQKAQVNSKITGKLAVLDPMQFNKIVEYPNQATTGMARLLSIEIEPGLTVWDLYDTEMELKEEYKDKYKEWEFDGAKLQEELITIKEAIKKIHGDYSEEGKMQAKNHIIGQMATFFKTWVARTVINRFGAENETRYLGTQKGRYKSFTEGSASMAGAVVGTTFMPGIGTVVGGFGGFLAGKLFGRKSEKKFLEEFFGTGMDLIRKMMRSKSKNYSDQFDEVDAANMRANMQELAFMLSLVGTYILAKLALWDEDEPMKNQVAHNITLNQINRFMSDLTFYTNPQTPGDMVDQAIPIAKLFTNGSRLMSSGLKLMYGKELQANENTFTQNFAKNVPVMFRPIFGEPIISKHEQEKEMFPRKGLIYPLFGVE